LRAAEWDTVQSQLWVKDGVRPHVLLAVHNLICCDVVLIPRPETETVSRLILFMTLLTKLLAICSSLWISD